MGIGLQGVGWTVGGRAVLADLTLDLTEARIGIVGRNGSGKTTLLRLIAGLIAPSTGSVRLDGIDPYSDRKAALSRVGVLFQNPDHQILFPTVEEELAFGLRQQGLSQAAALDKARQALASEGRGPWAKVPVSTLSGGQKHYLCLLAVLLMGPGTILLDEPFAGLDLPTIHRVTRRLAALPQRLVIVSHDPAAVAATDRVLWLDAGRLVLDGPPRTVLPAFAAEMARIGGADADTDLTA